MKLRIKIEKSGKYGKISLIIGIINLISIIILITLFFRGYKELWLGGIALSNFFLAIIGSVIGLSARHFEYNNRKICKEGYLINITISAIYLLIYFL